MKLFSYDGGAADLGRKAKAGIPDLALETNPVNRGISDFMHVDGAPKTSSNPVFSLPVVSDEVRSMVGDIRK